MSKTAEYFNAAKKELTKVSWPDWPKVAETSLVVGGCTAIFAIYLYVVDLGISQVFRQFFYN